MRPDEFEEHVRAALDDLPPELARPLQNVAIVVEDEHPEDPDLLGWYDGLGPASERAGQLPDRVVIYRRPLVESFPTVDLFGSSVSPLTSSVFDAGEQCLAQQEEECTAEC